jgi:CheY-like chemotaxis protein
MTRESRRDDHLAADDTTSPVALANATATGVEVVGEAATGRAGVESLRSLHPDLVLMDVRMPDLDGITATREVLTASPQVKVVILTTFEDNDIFGALHAGASSFLLKRTSPEELLSAIHTVAAGDSLLSPSVTRIVIELPVRRGMPCGCCREALLVATCVSTALSPRVLLCGRLWREVAERGRADEGLRFQGLVRQAQCLPPNLASCIEARKGRASS